MKPPIPERARWRIANRLDRLPGQCWANLALWALHASWDRDDHPWWRPLSSTSRMCQQDAARCGTCWCGKLQDEAVMRRWEAEHGEPWPSSEADSVEELP